MTRRLLLTILPLAAAVTLTGCAPKRPPVVEAGGVVLLNDKPLPFAYVEFVPVLEHFGAEMSSTATTDEDGRFALTCTWKNQSGAAVGRHKVVVREAPVPPDLRGIDAQSQARLEKYQNGLRNRPIPEKYDKVVSTPVEVEVKPGQTEYKVELTRP